ncbi:MAG: hypothetical protein A2V70_16795 [Planctomycetes bacterium RBG_13_63_9]|nr:MAG: hypothetical protein A2V70_16795 [Planctomycetes bacterium RBG_13_63_9]
MGQPESPAGPAGLCEKEAKEGFVCLFDGKTLDGWQGAVDGHVVEKGVLVCTKHGGGNLFTKKEYGDFIFRFEYKLEPGGNNGVGIRAPLEGTPAFTAIEIQILDNAAPEWKELDPVQLNGTVYGVVAAKQGHEKPPGQWNAMEIMAKGPHVKVTLNDTVIVDADLRKAKPTPIRGDDIEGLRREKGYIGFCGHGHRVEFRDIRIKDLRDRPEKPRR